MSKRPHLLAQKLTLDASPEQLFQRCEHQPYALFLDSASDQHPNSRYSMILTQPWWVIECRAEKLTLHADQNELTEAVPTTTKASEAFALAQQLIVLSGDYQGPEELPFQGGAAGIIGYDYGRQLEVLPAHISERYQTPDLVLCGYRQALLYDNQQQQYWLLAPAEQWQQQAQQWQQSPQPASQKFQVTSAWQSNLSKTQYLQRFQRVQEYLHAGDCYQINLAQRFSAQYQGSEWLAYRNLREHNKAPFSAFFRLPQSAVLSISPERFLAATAAGEVQTKPIKGTRPRYPDPQQDNAAKAELAASPKDRAENLMIVDLLRNDLSKVCLPHSVKVPELFAIESFPSVHHLVTTVTGKLARREDALPLFAGAFPGGSITGAPKIRAMQIIEELEPHRRNIYCGSVAYFSQHGQMDSSITIRTLLAEQGTLYCWAGGGLVADSIGEDEYQETFDKVSRILPRLNPEHG